jgi:hypothetical protein
MTPPTSNWYISIPYPILITDHGNRSGIAVASRNLDHGLRDLRSRSISPDQSSSTRILVGGSRRPESQERKYISPPFPTDPYRPYHGKLVIGRKFCQYGTLRNCEPVFAMGVFWKFCRYRYIRDPANPFLPCMCSCRSELELENGKWAQAKRAISYVCGTFTT